MWKRSEKPPKDKHYDPKQIMKGLPVEMEHFDTVGNDPDVVMQIVHDHLDEDPKYYDKLEKVHKEKKSAWGDSFNVGDWVIVTNGRSGKHRGLVTKVVENTNYGTLYEVKSEDDLKAQHGGTMWSPQSLTKDRSFVPDAPAEWTEDTPEQQEALVRNAGWKRTARIVKREDGYHVLSEKGKNLGGPYASREGAEKRLRQVEYFKHQGSVRKSGRVKLSGFIITSAKIDDLADKKRQQLFAREDVKKLIDTYRLHNKAVSDGNGELASSLDKSQVGAGLVIKNLLDTLPNESYKLYEWIVREAKAGHIDQTNYRHAKDIVEQATKWQQWVKEYNRKEPEYNPDYKAKDFNMPQLEQWVYDMNAKDLGEHDPNKIEWPDSETVHTFPNGWRVDIVGSGDLAQEGQLMGHCIGGYCDIVDAGESEMYSLRDPKGQPHVTAEVKKDGNEWIIVQEQGKGNARPKSEYQDMMDAMWAQLEEDKGVDITHSEDAEPEEEYRDWGPNFNIDSEDDALRYFNVVKHDPHEFAYDQEPEYDTDRFGRPIRIEMNPRDVTVDVPALRDTIVNAINQYAQGERDSDSMEELLKAAYFATHHAQQIEKGNTYQGDVASGEEVWNSLVDGIEQTFYSPTDPNQQQIFDTGEWKPRERTDSPQTDKVMRFIDQLSRATAPKLPHQDTIYGDEIEESRWAHEGLDNYRPSPYARPKPSWHAMNNIVSLEGAPHPDIHLHKVQMEKWQPVYDQWKMEQAKKERERALVGLMGGPQDSGYRSEWTKAPQVNQSLDEPITSLSSKTATVWHDPDGALHADRLGEYIRSHSTLEAARELMRYYRMILGYNPVTALDRASRDLFWSGVNYKESIPMLQGINEQMQDLNMGISMMPSRVGKTV